MTSTLRHVEKAFPPARQGILLNWVNSHRVIGIATNNSMMLNCALVTGCSLTSYPEHYTAYQSTIYAAYFLRTRNNHRSIALFFIYVRFKKSILTVIDVAQLISVYGISYKNWPNEYDSCKWNTFSTDLNQVKWCRPA